MTVRVEFQRGAISKIRSLHSTRSALEHEGRQVLRSVQRSFTPNGSSDPPGYNMVTNRYPSGYRVGVGAYSTHAKRHNARHNTLLRSLRSA